MTLRPKQAGPTRRRPRRAALLRRAPTALAAAAPGLALAGALAVALAASLATAPAPAAAQQRPAAGAPTIACQRCHGDLELLRQQTGSLPAARRALVPDHVVAASAHGELACAGCHAGYGEYPHRTRFTRTSGCIDCHEAAHEAWSRGVHAGAANGEVTGCAACHGVHDVLTTAQLAEAAGIQRMNAACAGCHQGAALPPTDPHRAEVGCAGCHTAHETRSPGDPRATTAPANQHATCGACHEEVAARSAGDAHGQAVARWAAAQGGTLAPGDHPPPTCTTCHGAHGVQVAADTAYHRNMIFRCGECHEYHRDSYLYTYHGKAVRLGSPISATCADCHSAHGVHPASDARSLVAAGNLVATCGQCHAYARPAFVLYDSHPNPLDRERNPMLFYSFWFMNILLIGVLTVFGLHTLLWWVRLKLDERRGIRHGPHWHAQAHGHGHGPGGQGHGDAEGSR
jgi:hypothetical protein